MSLFVLTSSRVSTTKMVTDQPVSCYVTHALIACQRDTWMVD